MDNSTVHWCQFQIICRLPITSHTQHKMYPTPLQWKPIKRVTDQWHNVIVFHKANGSYLYWELIAGTTSADSCTQSKPGVNERNLYKFNIIYDRKNNITKYLNYWVESCISFVITRNNPAAASHFIYSQFIVLTSVLRPAGVRDYSFYGVHKSTILACGRWTQI